MTHARFVWKNSVQTTATKPAGFAPTRFIKNAGKTTRSTTDAWVTQSDAFTVAPSAQAI